MRVTVAVTVRPVPVVVLLIGVLVSVTMIDDRFRPLVHVQGPTQLLCRIGTTYFTQSWSSRTPMCGMYS
jgi:hypothetical protein